jgi:hypothetical protein
VTPASTPGRIGRLALIASGVASIVVLMLATPRAPTDAPPVGQIQVAPLAAEPEIALEVLVPGDMGRVLSPFMVMLEGDWPDGEQPSVWKVLPNGQSYAVEQ